MKPARLPIVAALVALAAGPAVAGPANAPATITLDVAGLHSARGQLIVCLWRDKAGFPNCEKSKTARRVVVPVTATAMQVALPLPAAGDHAVTVVHDEDGNGKMKRNFIGMPTEGVGISNNPGGMPGYAKSLAHLTPGGAITIRMRYLFD